MASVEDHAAYGEEDLDEDDEDESEDEDHDRVQLHLSRHPPQNDVVVDEDDDDVDIDDDDSTSSSILPSGDPSAQPPSAVSDSGQVTIAVAGVQVQPVPGNSLPDLKRQQIEDVTAATVVEEKKPLPLDESRRLFQRLWTDEDEIELLQGFLDYTTQRGTNNSSHHHHDTTAFYDQIKSKLQLDFNKNQLVEKLRRLKKKYRNVLNKIGSGKDYIFKSSHDQATFEISQKIWSGICGRAGGAGDGGLDDDDANPSPYPNSNLNDHCYNGVDVNNSDRKTSRSRKRPRGVKIEEKPAFNQQPIATATATPTPSIPNLIEETMRNYLSPLLKELLHNAVNGPNSSRGLGLALHPMPLGFGGSMNIVGGDVVDEKWRKQQILELEVYAKRLELVQDQIRSQLEELRSMGS